ncbi:MAG: phosphatase PAP2 family protein [Gemmataceae bacterium]
MLSKSLRFERLETRDLPSSNVVLDWDAAMLQAIRTTKTPPPIASRALAMESLAVYDAVALINRSTTVFPVDGLPKRAPNDAIDAVSAAAAAYTVSSALFPTQQSAFQSVWQGYLSTLPQKNSPAVSSSITFGTAVGQAVLASRSHDGSTTVIPYVPGTAPGDWVPTPPANAPALLPNWGNVTPFVLTSGSEFLPPAPPALNSPLYLKDLAQVQSLGSSTSTTRTADQTQIARFWDDSGGSATPPGHWNQIAAQVIINHPGTLLRDAQVFAALNTAMADSAIAAWNAKYTYNDWRPVTAIRQTQNDPTWSSLITTPPFPTYVSGHSTFSGAAATVLTGYFGSHTSFTIGSDLLPGVTRSFTSFAVAAQEAGMSRIYGGIHYQFDNLAGLALGGTIGAVTLHDFLPAQRQGGSGRPRPGNSPAMPDVFYMNLANRTLDGSIMMTSNTDNRSVANDAARQTVETYLRTDPRQVREGRSRRMPEYTSRGVVQPSHLLEADAVAFAFVQGVRLAR